MDSQLSEKLMKTRISTLSFAALGDGQYGKEYGDDRRQSARCRRGRWMFGLLVYGHV